MVHAVNEQERAAEHEGAQRRNAARGTTNGRRNVVVQDVCNDARRRKDPCDASSLARYAKVSIQTRANLPPS